MKSAVCLILTLFHCFSLKAEIIMEYNGHDWKETGPKVSKTDENFNAMGRAFIADAKTNMKDAAPLWEMTKQPQPHAIRVALRDQEGKGGVFSPIPNATTPKGLITIITCDPKRIDAGCMRIVDGTKEIQLYETGRMSPDFEGLEKFSEVLKAGIKRANDEGTPAIAGVIVRSETSWGQMVRMVQVMNAAGFRHGTLRLDDSFIGLDTEVKQDPGLTATGVKGQDQTPGQKVPMQIGPDQPKTGRIVINVFEDGTIKDVNGKILASDQEITAYVKREKERYTATGHQVCKLHLRGEQDSLVRHTRRVIRLSAAVGVDQVNFAGYSRPVAPQQDTAPVR